MTLDSHQPPSNQRALLAAIAARIGATPDEMNLAAEHAKGDVRLFAAHLGVDLDELRNQSMAAIIGLLIKPTGEPS